MGLLLFGIIMLIGFMGVVMLTPCIYYLKRDFKWDASQPNALDMWYN